MLNKITLWFLNRAFAQMESAGALQNADDVAEFIEDYFDEMVKEGLTFEAKGLIM